MKRVALVAAAVIAVIAGALFLWRFSTLVLLVLGALVLAATVHPVVEAVERRGLPRAVAVGINLFLTTAVLLLFLAISGYALADNLPRALTDFQRGYAGLHNRLEEGGRWEQALAARLPAAEGLDELAVSLMSSGAGGGEPADDESNAGTDAPAPEEPAAVPATAVPATAVPATAVPATAVPGSATVPDLANAPDAGSAPDAPALSQQGEPMAGQGAAVATADEEQTERALRTGQMLRLFAGATSSVAAILGQVILLIFIALYWSLQRNRVERLWLSLVPARDRQRIRQTWRTVEESVGLSVRMVLLQAALALGLLWVGFWLMGVNYPPLAAWLGALFWLIPLVGWMMAVPVVALIGLLESPAMALAAAGWALAVFALLSLVIERRAGLRQRMGVVTALVVALVVFEAFGLLGLLVAAPVAVALHTLLIELTTPIPTLPEVQAAAASSIAGGLPPAAADITRVLQSEADLPARAPDPVSRAPHPMEPPAVAPQAMALQPGGTPARAVALFRVQLLHDSFDELYERLEIANAEEDLQPPARSALERLQRLFADAEAALQAPAQPKPQRRVELHTGAEEGAGSLSSDQLPA